MKAFSIRQPWASLIAAGRKTIETRVWTTDHRGPLLICSARRWAYGFKLQNPGPLFTTNSVGDYPLGMALCVAEVIDCRPMVKADELAACCEIYPDAHSWVLGNIRLIKPFAVRGALKFFDVPDDLIQRI